MMPYQYEQHEVNAQYLISDLSNRQAQKGWRLVSVLGKPRHDYIFILVFEKWVEPTLPEGEGPYR